MKKALLILVMTLILVSGAFAYRTDARLGLAFSKALVHDPNPARTDTLGDADVTGLGISFGTTVRYYNDTAFWADLSIAFPGQFKFDGNVQTVGANSYLFYTDVSAGAAFIYELKNIEVCVGIGYSFSDITYRYEIPSNSQQRFMEYDYISSGPVGYVAAKLDVNRAISLQFTAIPKLIIHTTRLIDKQTSWRRNNPVRDHIFQTSFAVNASISLSYMF